ncbi:MAG: Glycine cleavage system H protein [Firmicutes bacterium ADurb.Bin182]|nr:MAG: Glycine cleavage system H protein [Firmicutes bacterium ADurb.Bin182]
MTPNDRKYTKEHEWVKINGSIAEIGITDHAQQALGDIVFVELPNIDDTVSAGDSAAVVESVKAVSNIYTAAEGRIVEVNESLDERPELLNENPYENFIFKVEFTKVDENALISAEEYDAFVESEA